MPKLRYLKAKPKKPLRSIAASIATVNLLLLIVLALLLLTGCGPGRVINSGCGGDLRPFCDAIFGPVDRQDELAEASQQQAKELELLRRQVQQLESDMKALEDELALQVQELENTLNLSLSELQIYVDASTGQLRNDLEGADQELRSLIERNRVRINRALRRIRHLRSDLDAALTDIAVLQGYPNIVQIHDPCGPSGGFDEVVLELADGSYLAYFEQGSRRFLSLLPPGNYRTTDASVCAFTIPIAN